MLDNLISRFCVHKNEQWSRADYNPPVWWTYVTQPVGWFVMRQGRRLEQKLIADLERMWAES